MWNRRSHCGLRLAERDKAVAILEKAPKENRGGHTQFTESFRIPTADINLDVEFNVDDYSEADFYSDIMKVTNFRADPGLADVVTGEAAEMFEWLTEKGVSWEYQAPHPGYTAGRVWLDGEEMIDEIIELLEEAGVDIYYRAEARSLNRSGDGTVDGVEAFVDGMRTQFEADAIVLAAGDYGSSKEKRTRYYGPGYGNMKVRGSRYNTGEGSRPRWMSVRSLTANGATPTWRSSMLVHPMLRVESPESTATSTG